MSVDPYSLAKLWLLIKPIKRIKERRARKRLEKQGISFIDTEEPSMNQENLGLELLKLVVRHGLTFGGGAGLLSDNEIAQFSAAIATLAGLAWSGYRKWKRAREA